MLQNIAEWKHSPTEFGDDLTFSILQFYKPAIQTVGRLHTKLPTDWHYIDSFKHPENILTCSF